MDGRQWLSGLGGGEPRAGRAPEPDWLDVLVWVQEQHPERGGAARYLAERFGVDVRSAQRWLKLDHAPSRTRELRRTADELRAELRGEWQRNLNRRAARESRRRRGFVADLLEEVDTVTPGKVWVVPKSDPSGRMTPRTIGPVDVDLSKVAERWRDGEDEEAAEELSDEILNAYGGLGDFLRIVDYETGPTYS